MDLKKFDSLMHPARIRILLALRETGAATTRELARRCPGISPATLYRHVGALKRDGVLEVAREDRVCGAVERTYRLREDLPAQAEAAGAEDLPDLLARFLLANLADFRRYLDTRPENPRDESGFRCALMHLTREEFAEMRADLNRCLQKYLAREPGPGRKTWRFSTIVVPVDADAEDPVEDPVCEEEENS